MKNYLIITLAFTLILYSCMRRAYSTSIQQSPVFDKQGHRGCRGLMPENTIPAMIEAVNLGVTTLEMDVVFTKDNIAVLSHEPFFNHEITTKNDGTYINEGEEKTYNIFKMNYEEVKLFDVGLKPHPRFPNQQKISVTKPKLEDVITLMDLYTKNKKLPPVFYNIETKTQQNTDNIYHPLPEIFIDNLLRIIMEKDISKRVIIQSFDYRILKILHQKYPAISTAMLVEDFDKRSIKELLNTLGFKPTIYSPHFSLINNEMIEACHKLKIKIIPWTVNDKDKITLLKMMGVDGIITDYPNLFD